MKFARNSVWLLAALVTLTTAPTTSLAESFQVLLFSKTAGFRHASITNAIVALRELAATNDFSVTNTEDATAFTDANLAQFRAVAFVMTTGDVLNDTQQAAFERFIRAGKGYVGIHSASDTEYSWPWYGGLVGAYFLDHPAQQTATIHIEDTTHPSTRFLPTNWVRFDEWYNFQSNPRANVHVLARLDESTYSGGSMDDHPIAWCHDYDGGRAWYTGGGHTAASYSEPLFRRHLVEGIIYAAGWQPVLSVALGTNEIALSWPIGPVFSVQSRSSFQTNSSWTAMTNQSVGTNGFNQMKIPVSSSMQYFRLAR